MGVSPFGKFAAVYVSVGNVHAANIAYIAVNDAQFAVVAPIYAGGKYRECYFEKRIYFDSGFFHLVKEAVGDFQAADVVIYNLNFDALVRLFYKYVFDLVADGVVFKDIVLQVNVFLGGPQVSNHCVEFFLAVGENLNAVAWVE
jgi:hypothetical protein